MRTFTPAILDLMDERFVQFLSKDGLEETDSVFPIPTEISAMLSVGMRVKNLPQQMVWNDVF